MDEQAFFWKMRRGELPIPPIAAHLGFQFRSWDEGSSSIEVSFVGKPEFCNPVGKIHGGMLSAMLDETLALLVAATLARGEFAPTLNLNVNFLRPADQGEIVGRGTMIRRGKEICVVEGLLLQGGQAVASATASMFIRRGGPV